MDVFKYIHAFPRLVSVFLSVDCGRWSIMCDYYFPTHHDCHVAHTLEGVVHASIRHIYQDLLDRLAAVLWVHHVCGAEFSSGFKLVRVEVNSNNPGCAGRFTAHDCCKAQRSQSKHGTGWSGLHLHGAGEGRQAQVSTFLQWLMIQSSREKMILMLCIVPASPGGPCSSYSGKYCRYLLAHNQ